MGVDNGKYRGKWVATGKTVVLGIPDDADQRSGHADHPFRDDGDHDSGMMPITRSGMIPIS